MDVVLLDASPSSVEQLEYFEAILEHLGVRIYRISRMSADELAKGRVLMIAGKRFEKYTVEEREIIIKHTQAGHRLIVMLDGDSVPFFDSMQDILGVAGIYIKSTKVLDGASLEFSTRNINRSHAITMGVDELYFRNAVCFLLAQKRTTPIEILIRSEKNHSPPEAILACMARLGNGRILAVSTWEILKEDMIRKGSNALFVVSAIFWLLDKKPPMDLIQRLRVLLR